MTEACVFFFFFLKAELSSTFDFTSRTSANQVAAGQEALANGIVCGSGSIASHTLICFRNKAWGRGSLDNSP